MKDIFSRIVREKRFPESLWAVRGSGDIKTFGWYTKTFGWYTKTFSWCTKTLFDSILKHFLIVY